MSLQKVTFNNKNKISDYYEQTVLTDNNINQLKQKFNNIIDYLNNFKFPVSSVNGQTGNVKFDFPVSSVNGLSGNIIIDFPVSSVNGKTGNVLLKTSDIPNNSGYITTNDIPVSSVNGQTGNVKFDFPVSSVNGLTGHVKINFPVSSVNGKTGNVILKTSDLQNDIGFITSNDIPVSSVNGKTGNVILKTSDLQNDKNYITLNNVPITSITVQRQAAYKNKDILTGKAIQIFVPSATTHLTNDSGYYTNLFDFMKQIQSIDDLAEATSGYLYCIIEEEND